jgi:hypothetical protein
VVDDVLLQPVDPLWRLCDCQVFWVYDPSQDNLDVVPDVVPENVCFMRWSIVVS